MDYVLPFTFEDRPIKGKLIRLENSFKDIIKDKNYPEKVHELLAEFLIFAVYLGSSLKTEGSVAIQLQTKGALKLLFVECRSSLDVRGIAKLDEQLIEKIKTEEIFSESDLKTAKLALTITADQTNHTYQSLVPVISTDISEVFREFIKQSEQIDTALDLKFESDSITGLFLQLMPEAHGDALKDDNGDPFELKDLILEPKFWDFNTTNVIPLSGHDILMAMFQAHELRVYDSSQVRMKCNCGRSKVEELITVLGMEDAEKLLAEQGSIKVTCEMCGESQEFDKIDVAAIFDTRINKDLSTSSH